MFKLLNDIKFILDKDRNEKEAKRMNGDLFNLFSTLNLSTNELVHSRMIAELLNPQGSHGKGDIFLRHFLSIFDFKFNLDTTTAKVFTEFDTGPITKNYTRGGKIDILITDAYNHAIIIENKIYAEDQKKQLLRYANYAKSQNYEFDIVYLTLDFHNPSELSTGKDPDFDYVMFSYEEDILPWLDNCMSECNNNSIIYNSIFQYSQCIRKILNLMKADNKKALIDIATDSNNIDTVLALFKNEESIKRCIIDKFLKSLCEKAKEMGYTVEFDEKYYETTGTFMSFHIPEQSEKWALFIGNNKRNLNDVYFSLELFSGFSSKIKKADLTHIPHLWNVFEQDKETPCGWSYFWSDSGEKYSGNWYNWYDNDTIQAMADGTLLNYIVQKILSPIITTKVFTILNNY